MMAQQNDIRSHFAIVQTNDDGAIYSWDTAIKSRSWFPDKKKRWFGICI